jgi:hypothetical protein
MLIQLMLGITMFVGLGVLILQSHPFRPLAAGLLIAPAPLRVPEKRRDGVSLPQAAVDAWENEGGAAQPSKP